MLLHYFEKIEIPKMILIFTAGYYQRKLHQMYHSFIEMDDGHMSLCLMVTLVSPAKTPESIEMPFGLWARIGPRNRVLDGGPEVLRDVAMATIFGFLYVECTLALSGEYD